MQWIDGTQWFTKLRKNLGQKNCELGPDDIERIVRTFLDFGEHAQSKIFPNAACAVSLVDRLVHHCEVVRIEGESYRRKEALERQQQRQSERASRGKAKPAGKAA